jgi:hypothetical protein
VEGAGVTGRAPSGRAAKLTDDRVRLLLAGKPPDDDPTLSQLAALVRSTRRLYVEPPRPGVRERHEAMIAAAARGLPAAGPALAHRSRRFGALPSSHPRRAVALTAAALALGLAGAWAVTDTDRQAAPRISDRSSPAPVPERVGSPAPPTPRRQAERGQRHAPEKRPAAPPAPAPPASQPAPAPQQETAPPVEPEPEALAERPRPEVEMPVDPAPPPHRGYGGPDSTSAPLQGPLDTEPPITAPPEGAPAP